MTQATKKLVDAIEALPEQERSELDVFVSCIRRIQVLVLVYVCVLSSVSCAIPRASIGQEPNKPSLDNWHAIAELAPGTSVLVNLQDGTRMSGRLVRASDLHLTIREGGAEQRLLRPTIQRVTRVERQTRRKAINGMIIGAIAGSVLAASTVKTNRAKWGFAMGGGWAAIGAAIGASDGFTDRKQTTVYEIDGLAE